MFKISALEIKSPFSKSKSLIDKLLIKTSFFNVFSMLIELLSTIRLASAESI